MWRSVLEQEPMRYVLCSCVSRKSQKQLQHLSNLEVLIRQMPTRNDSSLLEQEQDPSNEQEDAPDLQRLLDRIRARYKLACTSLGLPGHIQLQHPSIGKAEPDDEQKEQEASKPRYSRVAGQLVDVTQLKY